MPKRANKSGLEKIVGLIFAGLFGLAFVIGLLLHGHNVALFNPKGTIARQQLDLIIICVLLMFTLGIPTLVVLFGFAWEYRESNKKAHYDPQSGHSKRLAFTIWALPSLFMIVLALIMWPAAHRLDPKKAIASDAKPMTVQVVALRWKWLFIYPEQHIASVNYVQFPANTPVQFVITADEAPMSSFWIPNLGGQLYAMTGHANELNLMASEAGDYHGRSAEINGAGFAGMTFTAHAGSQQEFDRWVQSVHDKAGSLDSASYADLLKPSENNPAATYGEVDPNLYVTILSKYIGSHDHAGQE